MANLSKKTEVRVAIDSNFLKELEDKLGVSKSTDLARIALSLLDWASDEVREGRIILTTDEKGKNVHRLVMPELTNMKKAG